MIVDSVERLKKELNEELWSLDYQENYLEFYASLCSMQDDIF
jgi:hypothetical protein